jgi:DNA modification methylase
VKVLPRNTVLVGDAQRVLGGLLPESVDCVVTSPPYFGLRDYGVAGQLGREAAVTDWVIQMRGVMSEIARVLKPHGSVWLNVGDAYSKHGSWGAPPKGLLAAPERLLLALAGDGWICRNKVVWAKPNPLPQSAADRLSPTYEFVYFLTRRPRYFFDLDAIRIPHRTVKRASAAEAGRRYQGGNGGLGRLKAAGRVGHPNGKNPGDIWTIPTAADRLAHQATFPEALIERPIAATCPERICVQCDRAWTRPVRVLTVHTNEGARTVRKVGALRRCDCFAPSRPGVVLDPFFGTGTVGLVAERLGRDWLGIELNPAYAELAERRIRSRRAA